MPCYLLKGVHKKPKTARKVMRLFVCNALFLIFLPDIPVGDFLHQKINTLFGWHRKGDSTSLYLEDGNPHCMEASYLCGQVMRYGT